LKFLTSEEIYKMKKLILITLTALFLSGCGTAAQRSEFFEHKTMYKNWDHLKYSWSGYKNTTPEAAEKSQAQDWWGIPVTEPGTE
jgi:hypothetical protein